MTHPTRQSLIDAFRAQAARTPQATALVIGTTALTYRELDHVSAGLAELLRRAGARTGTSVCIRLEQSAVAVAAVLAALRVGAAWSAIEPDLPPSRLRALLRDTDCAVVLAARDDQDLARLPDAPPRLAAEDLDLGALAEAGARAVADPVPAVPEDAPAYLVYTSGSTGTPKGVVVSRGALADSVRPRGAVYGTGPSIFLMAMRLSFDGMLAGMFWSFSNGHTLLLPTARELGRAPEFVQLARRHRATHLVVVPSYYRLLLTGPDRLPDSLRLVVVAGEVCTPELVRSHRAHLPGARLANEYGPTETVVSCTVEDRPDPALERIPIGRPWPGATARVLDERLREVADGELGELYVGGAFVASCYARAPGRTAERFVADPFGPPGARLYRTGDLARRDACGTLHYHGRTDHQVKVRGARVELGEIEAVLETHPAVDQAVVLCEERDADAPRLTAFLVPAAGHEPPDPRDLRGHCREQLVHQALPSRFVPVDRLPLTPTGKADRTALASLSPAVADRTEHPAGQGRRAGTRQVVGEIWAEVLGHRDAGPEDNFFVVGGDSLKVVELYRRLDARWPGAVRAGELFDLVTVTAQADVIDDRTGTDADTGDRADAEADAGERCLPDAGRPAPVSYEL
ncbi:amino acid adenylation domain-containing protein [Streptomyces nanhaiensis]|uniref:non-ribosomal peptide synthetase n=1 Tax=Streptomyces nanhaiensis TaxID=679319 RepID=UPI00399C93AF